MILDPDYARIFTQARIIAWQYGYACVAHGSYTRDLDLLLVPWEERATPNHAQLLKLIAQACGLRFRDGEEDILKAKPDFSDKPHGRTACSLFFPAPGDRRWVDVSIMPCAARVSAAEPPEISAAWNLVRAEARALTQDCGIAQLLMAVEAYADARVAAARDLPIDADKLAALQQSMADSAAVVNTIKARHGLDGGDSTPAPSAACEVHQLAHPCEACGAELPYREFLEHWTHEGHLQTFEDRERFRKAARELLADPPFRAATDGARGRARLTDDEIDRVLGATYRKLVIDTGYDGGMGGETWDRAAARAIEAHVLGLKDDGEVPRG